MAGALLVVHAIASLFLFFAAAGAGAGLHPIFLEYVLLASLAGLVAAGVGISLGARWGAILFGLTAAAALTAMAASILMGRADVPIDARAAVFLIVFAGVPALVASVVVGHRSLFWPR